MDDGKDLNLLDFDSINNSIPMLYDFAHVAAIELGHLAARKREFADLG